MTGTKLYQYDGYRSYEKAKTDFVILDEESEILITIDNSFFQNIRTNDVRDASLRTSYIKYFMGL